MKELVLVIVGFVGCYGLAWWTDSRWHWVDRVAGWPK